MPHDVVVDVMVPTVPVVDVAAVGVQGPPGEPGEPGPAGPPGPQGEPGDAAGPHAATHQTGGVDPITALDAGVLTGTVTTNVLAPIVTATAHVAVGASPAQSGAIRLGNNQAIVARTGLNDGDRELIRLNASNQVEIGVGTPLVGTDVVFQARARLDTPMIWMNPERADPGAPPGDSAFIYLRDNGAGKTQLMIQFATGAPVQIAIQP